MSTVQLQAIDRVLPNGHPNGSNGGGGGGNRRPVQNAQWAKEAPPSVLTGGLTEEEKADPEGKVAQGVAATASRARQAFHQSQNSSSTTSSTNQRSSNSKDDDDARWDMLAAPSARANQKGFPEAARTNGNNGTIESPRTPAPAPLRPLRNASFGAARQFAPSPAVGSAPPNMERMKVRH